MNVISAISAWAKELPPWQSDALRRLFTQDDFVPADESQVFAMMLKHHGLASGDDHVPTPKPFSQIIGIGTPESKSVVLKELHSVSGVNALVPNQAVQFALDGITVIYGENGAGKSGYTRVFRHACSAREKSDTILPDVRSSAKSAPEAIFELSQDGNDIAVKWTAGSIPASILNEIAVFDAHCARVFLDEANEVVYMPYGLDIFPKLAGLFDRLKSRISTLQRQIPQSFSRTSDFSESTIVGKFVRSLSAETSEEDLARHSRLDDQTIMQLAALREAVEALNMDSPTRKAAEQRRIANRVLALLRTITEVAASLTQTKVDDLRQHFLEMRAAAEAERLLSATTFGKEPVKGTGSNPWRVLFNAAKSFSEQLAYPGEEFPVTRDAGLCVLCQQELSAAAGMRLQRFKSFLQENVASRHQRATSEWEESSRQFRLLSVPSLASHQELVDELSEGFPDASQFIITFLESAETFRASVVEALDKGDWGRVGAPPAADTSVLNNCHTELSRRATEIMKADNPEERTRITRALSELEDQERLAAAADEVREFIRQKRQASALEQCVRSLDTAKVTRFGSQLMEQMVTEQLIANVNQELKTFRLGEARISIRRLGTKGTTKHKIIIADGHSPTEVLSEGEQRVLAIAAFLAEIATSPTTAPLVFDDPVSSLDHLYRERIARRLITEARSRQVIVFTHDIVMLLALERECGEQKVSFRPITVRRSSTGPGEFAPLLPWHAAKTKDRIGYLRNSCAGFQKLKETSPLEYERLASNTYGMLRETWERAIEEVLLNDTIQRFRPSVETQRLSRVSPEPADYVLIDQQMSKCSRWMTGHDSAGALNAAFPAPDELLQDINTLDTFVKALIKRQEQIKKQTDVLTRPPEPQIATTRSTTVIECPMPAA